jgi:small-conductance mechanosensitive channel
MLRIGLGITLSHWWDTITDYFGDKENKVARVILTIIVAVVVWILGRLIIRASTRGLRKGVPRSERRVFGFRIRKPSTTKRQLQDRLEAERRQQRARTIGVALRSTFGALVIIVALTTMLSVWGIQVGPLIAAAGILGVALGFGAQSLVKDILSGMFILLEDQYGVGDSVDLGEASGSVEEVGLRTTRLRSVNGTVWFVPNGEIRRVANKSRLWSRAMIEVRINYSQDVEVARTALLDAATTATEREEIAKHVLSAPTVPGVESLAADAVVLRVFVQVQPGQQWDVERAIRAEIQRVFRKRGIRLAVPENRVYVGEGSEQLPTEKAAPKARRQPSK